MACRCDPFGYFCFIFLYFLIGYVDYVCLVHVLSIDRVGQQAWFYILAAGYQLVLFMVIWSHLMCLCSNPGIVDYKTQLSIPNQGKDSSSVCTSPCEIEYILPTSVNNKVYQKSDSAVVRRNYTTEFEWTFCRHCQVYRPPRAHHCQICRRCILKMDHHCPWINNCVGEYNQKYFLQFTSYACAGSVYTLACILVSFVFAEVNTPVKVIHIALLILASVIFGIFSIAVLCDQVQGVFNDQTNIERLKGQKGPKKGRMKTLQQTCGYMSILLWLFPLPVNRKIDKDVEMEMSKNDHSYAL